MENYSAIARNNILPFETTWMDLGGIMLNETSQIKTNTYEFTYMWILKIKTNEQTNNTEMIYKY